jgi:hypothetical protein
MNNRIATAALLLLLGTVPTLASAKGCIAGAAVGGVAGHVIGGHGVLGAAAGCAIGHHRAAKKEKAAAAAQSKPAVPAK